MQRQTFFLEKKPVVTNINKIDFRNAIEKSDSKRIDEILVANRNGAYLELDQTWGEHFWNEKNALQILLKNGDFFNAGKLIAAGAQTVEKQLVAVNDPTDRYPNYVPQFTSVFDNINLYNAAIRELARGYLTYDLTLVNELNIGMPAAPKP